MGRVRTGKGGTDRRRVKLHDRTAAAGTLDAIMRRNMEPYDSGWIELEVASDRRSLHVAIERVASLEIISS